MKKLKFWGAALIFVILLLRPEDVVKNAQYAMQIWYSSVAPSLFPFLALMPILTSEEACAAYEAMFSKWMRPLFRLPGSAAPAVIAGMLAGSPGGAIMLCRVVENSDLSVPEARRIALALGGVSPAYLIICVGQGLHGSISLGIKLAAIQACVQLLMLLIIPVDDKAAGERTIHASGIRETGNPITSAVESSLGVCGYMVFYGVIAGIFTSMLGRGVGDVLLLLMDLPSGLIGLAASNLPLKMMIQGVAIGFSGLCIISQNMNALRELNLEWKQYLTARCISGLMLGILSTVMESDWAGYAGRLLEDHRKTYALSLLVVGIVSIPGLYLLSKKLFLNIRKNEIK